MCIRDSFKDMRNSVAVLMDDAREELRQANQTLKKRQATFKQRDQQIEALKEVLRNLSARNANSGNAGSGRGLGRAQTARGGLHDKELFPNASFCLDKDERLDTPPDPHLWTEAEEKPMEKKIDREIESVVRRASTSVFAGIGNTLRRLLEKR
eukprot:TRINITY_DN22921_c0_g1_i1.p2 TRINITY_DN22921_c0_g1~~TRINITY_DN22921_c0_g1_i1.p2  ORF type:complete len:172 (+),score=59.31 TRINITY_DN22921_c0_g1_i1:60-518(+)